MDEPTPPPTQKPNFFTSDKCTLFWSEDKNLWIYGDGIQSVGKHTPRVFLCKIGQDIRTRNKYWTAALFPVDGIAGERGHFSRYISGISLEVGAYNLSITQFYAKIQEHYTFNFTTSPTQTP
jgi:hypothetical protein